MINQFTADSLQLTVKTTFDPCLRPTKAGQGGHNE
jgi:hypothetical protein